ncbi:hypothetical protein DESC_750035 [Desulfosarcina cetonica]|nr:hypothetical protein DESC_750035 [Desulfosarcina cetonica]
MPAFSGQHPAQGKRPIAYKGLDQAGGDQKGGILPAAAWIGEDPTTGAVDENDGAGQDGNADQRRQAGLDAGHQGHTDDQLQEEGCVGQGRGQAEGAEEAGRTGQGEDNVFEPGMGQEHAAQGQAQNQCRVGGSGICIHGGLLMNFGFRFCGSIELPA